MSRRIKVTLCFVSALLAMAVIFYPLVSNYLGEKNRSLVQSQYTEAVKELDDSTKVAAREAARNYNATLVNVTDKAFSKEALTQAAESYDELLNIRGDGIMGYVEIPKISVNLPIYHGTEESSLERGAGHLLGSSLPVGGIGTHCVITGHSGLAGQRMFSDLNQLETGDVQRVKAAALPVVRVTGQYADGTEFTMPFSEIDTPAAQNRSDAHGGIKNIRYEPESEAELTARLMREHYIQIHGPIKKRKSI